jgi:hypothetical protein
VTQRRLITAALGTVGLLVGILAVVALREATMSTHSPAARGSRVEVVIDARTRHGEPSHTMAEMVDAQVRTCRLQVGSDLVGAVRPAGTHRFRAVLRPALDETDRRQFRGCLEDWLIDNVRIDVVALR